jgi:hypothetical protein
MDLPHGVDLGIEPVFEAAAEIAAPEIVDGALVLEGTAEDVTTVVQPTETGSRILSVLGSEDAPSEFAYDLAGTDLRYEASPDGGFDIYSTAAGADFMVGYVTAPWARDAEGTPIPTEYVLDGTRLTQVIDTPADAVFPVVADPALVATLSATPRAAATTGKPRCTVSPHGITNSITSPTVIDGGAVVNFQINWHNNSKDCSFIGTSRATLTMPKEFAIESLHADCSKSGINNAYCEAKQINLPAGGQTTRFTKYYPGAKSLKPSHNYTLTVRNNDSQRDFTRSAVVQVAPWNVIRPYFNHVDDMDRAMVKAAEMAVNGLVCHVAAARVVAHPIAAFVVGLGCQKIVEKGWDYVYKRVLPPYKDGKPID